MTGTLKIWYSYNHDDAAVYHINLNGTDPPSLVIDKIVRQGYMVVHDFDHKKLYIVPWHRINGIEVIDESDHS